MFKPATTPQKTEAIIQDSLALFISTWKPLSSLAFIVAFVSILPNILIPELNTEKGIQKFSDYLLLYFMGVIIFHNALLIQLHRLMYGHQKLPMTQVVSVGFYKMLTVLLASVLFAFAVGLGLFALILPGIVIVVRFFLYTPLIVIHNANIIDSFQTSYELTKNHALQTLQVMLIPVIAFFTSNLLVGIVLSIFQQLGVASEGQLFNALLLLLQFLVAAVITPFLYAFMLVQLHNLQLKAGTITPSNDDKNDNDKEFIA